MKAILFLLITIFCCLSFSLISCNDNNGLIYPIYGCWQIGDDNEGLVNFHKNDSCYELITNNQKIFGYYKPIKSKYNDSIELEYYINNGWNYNKCKITYTNDPLVIYITNMSLFDNTEQKLIRKL